MYCAHCGAWNPEESKFCAKCGQRLQTTSQAQQQPGRRLPLTLALVFLLVVVVTLCIAAFLARDRLARAWHSFVAQPTQVAIAPTATPTKVVATATATPTTVPSPSPTATMVPTPTSSPTPTPSPTPRPRTFKLVYKECIPHGFELGSVKGQVFDKQGKVIPGAKIKITIDGYEWQSPANPATTNPDGWYEWTLQVGQKVQFVELTVNGKPVPFSAQGFEVTAMGGCFQRVDFIEQ